MGTGKSSAGKRLAEALGREFVEMDSLIEQKEGMAINRIFSDKGESYFRDAEAKTVMVLAGRHDLIISAGGGVVLNHKNIDIFRKNSILICLDADPGEILKRVSKEAHRPLLNVADPLTEIKKLLNYRKPYYDKIRIHINTNGKNIEDVVSEIEDIVNGKDKGFSR